MAEENSSSSVEYIDDTSFKHILDGFQGQNNYVTQVEKYLSTNSINSENKIQEMGRSVMKCAIEAYDEFKLQSVEYPERKISDLWKPENLYNEIMLLLDRLHVPKDEIDRQYIRFFPRVIRYISSLSGMIHLMMLCEVEPYKIEIIISYLCGFIYTRKRKYEDFGWYLGLTRLHMMRIFCFVTYGIIYTDIKIPTMHSIVRKSLNIPSSVRYDIEDKSIVDKYPNIVDIRKVLVTDDGYTISPHSFDEDPSIFYTNERNERNEKEEKEEKDESIPKKEYKSDLEIISMFFRCSNQRIKNIFDSQGDLDDYYKYCSDTKKSFIRYKVMYNKHAYIFYAYGGCVLFYYVYYNAIVMNSIYYDPNGTDKYIHKYIIDVNKIATNPTNYRHDLWIPLYSDD